MTHPASSPTNFTPSIVPISSDNVRTAEHTIRECIELSTMVCYAMECEGDFDTARAGAARTLYNVIESLEEINGLLDSTGVTKNCEQKGFSHDDTSPAIFLDAALADSEKTIKNLAFQIDRFFMDRTTKKETAWCHLGEMKKALDLIAKAIGRPVPGGPNEPEDSSHETPPEQ